MESLVASPLEGAGVESSVHYREGSRSSPPKDIPATALYHAVWFLEPSSAIPQPPAQHQHTEREVMRDRGGQVNHGWPTQSTGSAALRIQNPNYRHQTEARIFQGGRQEGHGTCWRVVGTVVGLVLDYYLPKTQERSASQFFNEMKRTFFCCC